MLSLGTLKTFYYSILANYILSFYNLKQL